nr:efflux RND transporter periplasmic adaptor subunit [Nitrosomonas sp.]
LVRARSETERNRLKLANLGVHNRQMDGRFVLRAPLAGIVTERNINPGMEVKPDLPLPLFVISDLSRLWVLIDIFEKDIGLISRGAHVRIHVPAYPEESFVATIDYISQVVDETSRTVKVRCIIQNEDKRLLPAMFASATVLSDPGDRVVIIPLTALFSEGESDWVYIDTGNHRYLKRRVTVGLRTRNQAVIRDGLNPGERFVADGALLLRAEQKQHANEQ